MLFIIELNSLSAASSYQEWFRVKAQASKQGRRLFYKIFKHPAYNRDWHLFRGGFYSKKYDTHLKPTLNYC